MNERREITFLIKVSLDARQEKRFIEAGGTRTEWVHKALREWMASVEKLTYAENFPTKLTLKNGVQVSWQDNMARPQKRKKSVKVVRACRMCDHVFQQKNKNHFKCPRCGAHFTNIVEVTDV